MNILDNFKKIKKLDPSNMGGTIDLLAKQIAHAWQQLDQFNVPEEYKDINKVVINGMGGSGLGTHIIQSLFFKKLKVPIGNIHSYTIPGIVDKNTLFILSSYSGNTEEIIASYELAKKAGAKIIAIATGGKIGAWIKDGIIPGLLFNPKYNVCDQPRMAIGYAVIGLLGLLKKCEVLKVSETEITKVIEFINSIQEQFSLNNSIVDNLAKQTAEHLQDSIPLIVAAEFLAGNAHVFANQLNENAKNFSNYFIISELNHHLLEGLAFPKTNTKNLQFIFFESTFYHQRNQERIKITQDVLQKNKIDYLSYQLQGTTEMEQSFEMLLVGSYISFYLAILNNVKPAEIPWVDYFKTQLK